MRTLASGMLLVALVGLAGCGGTTPTSTATKDDPWANNDLFNTDTGTTTPIATGSPQTPGASGSLPGTTTASASTLPNNFFRYVGRDALGFTSWLSRPTGLATVGDTVLVADGGQADLLGAFGSVRLFNGRGAEAVTPVGLPYSELKATRPPVRLGSGVKAIATTASVLYVMDERGVYGFMLDGRNPLNLGNSYGTPGRDLAVAEGALYVARETQIEVVDAVHLLPTPATPSLNVGAVGLGSDPQGRLYVATPTEVRRYTRGQVDLSFDGKGKNGLGLPFERLTDVACDPRTGDIYALDRSAVQRYDAEGNFVCRIGADQLKDGASIALGAQGDVFVSDADATRRRVLQFEPAR